MVRSGIVRSSSGVSSRRRASPCVQVSSVPQNDAPRDVRVQVRTVVSQIRSVVSAASRP